MMTRRDLLGRVLAAAALIPCGGGAAAAVAASRPAGDGTADESAAPATPSVFPLRNHGGTLIVSHEPGAPLVALDVFFRVGGAEEGGRNGAPAGISALLSRAWAASTAGKTEALLGRDIRAIGGNVGTRFGSDWVGVYAVTRATDAAFQQAAQTLLFNIVGRPDFPDAAVERAKQEQLRALELENDDPRAHALSRLRDKLWTALPYGRSPLGTVDAVRAITPAQVRSFYDRYFRPDRAVIVVAGGGIGPERARQLVEQNLGASGFRDRGPAPRTVPPPPEVLPRTFTDLRIDRRGPVTILTAGFLAPGTRRPGGDAATTAAGDYTTLLLMEALLGGGKSSRLFRNLRDTRGIGYEIGALFEPGLYQSLMAGYVVTPAARRGTDGAGAGGAAPALLDEARRGLLDEMTSLATRPPDAAELARAKAYVTGRHAVRRQRLQERAFALGWSEVMGLGADFEATFDARIAAVTAADVGRLAAAVFGGHHVLASTLPE